MVCHLLDALRQNLDNVKMKSGRGVKPGTQNALKDPDDRAAQAGRVNAALLDKAKARAEVDGVKLRQVLEAALSEYLK